MGSNLREIIDNVCYPEIFLSFLNDKEKKKIGSKENAILEFYQQFACVGGDPVFSESLCKELQKKFFQQRCELGRIGRRNMNRRLNLDIPQNITFLLPRDILAAADHLIRMKFGMGTLDDMNHLKNKRIRSVADLLQDQFGLALVRLENVVRGTIGGAIRHKLIPTPHNLVSTAKETCLKLPIGGRGRVIDVRWIQKKGGSSYNPETIRVYISQKREIKVGDKVAGRHGNKASAIREQLADLDLRLIIDCSLLEWKELGEEGPAEPERMVLCLLPVLPPELRPIIQIDGVIYRNNTLTDLLTTSRSTPGELVMCQEKLVQEAVDTLLDNGIRGQPMRDGHNKFTNHFRM
ncbi:DNA-directed RNA polymerase [Ranunculus cassubicifolius]